MAVLMPVLWVGLGLLALAVVAVLVFLSRRAPGGNLLVAGMDSGRRHPLLASLSRGRKAADPNAPVTHDTVFVLPDISHYTRFMTGNRFAFAHAQHVVFSLINAMIEAATKTVELSKLEGDAALFYADADRHSARVIGETVMDIFRAFFQERQRLIESNLCPCRACRNIAELDLKLFVHRGAATRFEFRGSVDHFGTDVIILHRMMKNGVEDDRYVMVTDAASGCVSFPEAFETFQVEESIEDVGTVRASVHKIDGATVEALSRIDQAEQVSPVVETLRKLGENVRSVCSVFRRRAA